MPVISETELRSWQASLAKAKETIKEQRAEIDRLFHENGLLALSASGSAKQLPNLELVAERDKLKAENAQMQRMISTKFYDMAHPFPRKERREYLRWRLRGANKAVDKWRRKNAATRREAKMWEARARYLGYKDPPPVDPRIIGLLNEKNDILMDMVWRNGPPNRTVKMRLPVATWRKIYSPQVIEDPWPRFTTGYRWTEKWNVRDWRTPVKLPDLDRLYPNHDMPTADVAKLSAKPLLRKDDPEVRTMMDAGIT